MQPRTLGTPFGAIHYVAGGAPQGFARCESHHDRIVRIDPPVAAMHLHRCIAVAAERVDSQAVEADIDSIQQIVPHDPTTNR